MKEKVERIHELLQQVGTFYVATIEDGKPHNRPLDINAIYEDKLYFITKAPKNFFRQISNDPHFSLVAALSQDSFFRMEGEFAIDDRREAKAAVIAQNEDLCKGKYDADSDLTQVFYVKHGTTKVLEHGKDPEIIEW